MCYNCTRLEHRETGATMGKLTVRQVAEQLGYHPNHVRRLLRAGSIKGHKLAGVVWQIDQEEIERIKRERVNDRLYTDKP